MVESSTINIYPFRTQYWLNFVTILRSRRQTFYRTLLILLNLPVTVYVTWRLSFLVPPRWANLEEYKINKKTELIITLVYTSPYFKPQLILSRHWEGSRKEPHWRKRNEFDYNFPLLIREKIRDPPLIFTLLKVLDQKEYFVLFSVILSNFKEILLENGREVGTPRPI